MFEEFLRKIPIFADLPEKDLIQLCKIAETVYLSAGQVLFYEGNLAENIYILYKGDLEIVKYIKNREVVIDIQSQPGTIIGEMAFLTETKRLATVRSRNDSLLLSLGNYQMNEIIQSSPEITKIMLHTLMRRWRDMETQVLVNERMAQLGTFTAGIAHELNNPTAAVQRSTDQLQTLLDAAIKAYVALGRFNLSTLQQAKIDLLEYRIHEITIQPLAIDPLTRGDREEQIEIWLKQQNITNSWDLASTIVNLDLEVSDLTEIAEIFTIQFSIFMDWLKACYTVNSLLSEISSGTARITDIVKALKSYIYLDQAPIQSVDIHSGLDNTLIILHSRLEPEIIVLREYSANLPKITAYGSELNQVWTNLIDNAIDAINGHGLITIRTRHEDDVIVEIEDNGLGISPEHLSKIFDPFFTTKPLGVGTGLGLSISYNIVHKHKGQITVISEPGRTVFQVRLPLH